MIDRDWILGSDHDMRSPMPTGHSRLNVLDQQESRGHATCISCPSLCRSACPVADVQARETSSPHRLMIQSALLKRDQLDASQLGDFPWHCATCYSCTDVCQHDVDVPMFLTLARGRIFEAGCAPETANECAALFGVAGNPCGKSLEPTLSSVIEEAGATVRRRSDYVYFPGCETLNSVPHVASSVLRGMSLMGLEQLSVTPASATCCGLPMLWAGEIEGFIAHATRFVRQFDSAKLLVSHEPSCTHAIQNIFPRFGIDVKFKIASVSKYLTDNWGNTSKSQQGKSYAYMNSCSLSRGLKEASSSLDLLKQILGAEPKVLDPEEIGVGCCGASGLLPMTSPSTAKAMGEAWIQVFRDSGADSLVIFSPRCVSHLLSIVPEAEILDGAALLSQI